MDGDNLQSTRSLTGQDGINIDSIVGPPNSFIYLDSAGDVDTLAFSDGFLKSTSNVPSFDYPTVDEIDTTVLTASRAMVTDSSKRMRTSVVTDTELSYIQGLASNLQTQLNTINSLISTLNTSVYSMTPNRAAISDANGDLSTSSVTTTELGYVSGVTSNIQTQLNSLSSSGWTETAGVFSPTSGTVTKIGCSGDVGVFSGLGVGYANSDSITGLKTKNVDIAFNRDTAAGMKMEMSGIDGQNVYIDLAKETAQPDYQMRMIAEASGTSSIFTQGGNLRLSTKDANGILLYTNDTSRFTINSSGNLAYKTNVLFGDYANGRIGISNSSPSVPLDVTGAVKISGDLSVDTNVLKVDTTNNRVGVNTTSPSVALDVTGATNITGNVTVATNVLKVDTTSSRVGINKTTPSYTLDVVGTCNISANLSVDSSMYIDTDTLAVNSATNRVGIKTVSPTVELHVEGEAYISSDFEVGGASTLTGLTTCDSGININNANATIENGFYLLQKNLAQVTIYPWTMTTTSPSNGKYDGSSTPDWWAYNFATSPTYGSYINHSASGVTVTNDQYWLQTTGSHKITVFVPIYSSDSSGGGFVVVVGKYTGGGTPSTSTFTASDWKLGGSTWAQNNCAYIKIASSSDQRFVSYTFLNEGDSYLCLALGHNGTASMSDGGQAPAYLLFERYQ